MSRYVFGLGSVSAAVGALPLTPADCLFAQMRAAAPGKTDAELVAPVTPVQFRTLVNDIAVREPKDAAEQQIKQLLQQNACLPADIAKWAAEQTAAGQQPAPAGASTTTEISAAQLQALRAGVSSQLAKTSATHAALDPLRNVQFILPQAAAAAPAGASKSPFASPVVLLAGAAGLALALLK